MPDNFKLTVPVNASEVQGVNPGSAVKVALVDLKGNTVSEVVKLDDKDKRPQHFLSGQTRVNPKSL